MVKAKSAPGSLGQGKNFSVEELVINRGVVVEEIDIEQLDLNDRTFALHDEDHALALEKSIADDGQVEPIIVRKQQGRWQVVDGFRRVHALLRLGAKQVKARRFDALSATDAALWVVREVTTQPPQPAQLEGLAERLEAAGHDDAGMVVRRYVEVLEGQLAPAAEAPLDQETEEGDEDEEEISLDALSERALYTLADASEDLAVLQENWADVPDDEREQIRAQLRYYAELLPFLED